MRAVAQAMLVLMLIAMMASALEAGPGGGRFRARGGGEDGAGGGRRREGGGPLARLMKDAPPQCKAELQKLMRELRQKNQELRLEYEKKAEALIAECKAKNPSPASGPAPDVTPGDGGPAPVDDDGGDAASPAPAASPADDGHK